MARVSIQEVQAWLETTKLTLSSLDTDFLSQLETMVLARIATAYDVSGWTTTSNTPQIVRTVIAMKYAAWYYRKVYSEDEGTDNEYAQLLDAGAEALISGIVSGSVAVVEVTATTAGQPAFYPTDASTALEPTSDDLSLGPPAFSVGRIF